jgi:uncharacterized protein (TIGR00255 family)
MIRSMTAFAVAERATPAGQLMAELRGVNHRYLELSLRLPEDLRGLEPVVREQVAARVGRGKLEFSLRLRTAGEGQRPLRLNHERIEQLATARRELEQRFGPLACEFTDLLAFPGVLADAGADPAQLQADAVALLGALLDDFVAAREREGAALAAAITQRLDGIAAVVAQMRGWLPDIRAALRQRLESRLAEVAHGADPGRLEQEVVLALHKSDVDEELDRLDTHLAEARRLLRQGDAVGRRLDFLLQEFNREANTLGSKSIDQRSSQAAVELKVLIEQIREQVQNLE